MLTPHDRTIRIAAFVAAVAAVASIAATRVEAQTVLTVDEAVRIAIEANRSIALARNGMERDRNDATAGNAGFLPRVDLNAGVSGATTSAHQRLSTGETIDRESASATTTSAGVTASWTVFDGFRMFNRSDQLAARRERSELDLALARQRLHAQVIAAYYNVVAQQRTLDVLADVVKVSEERAGIAQTKFEVGSAPKRDLLQARLDLNTDRAALLAQGARLSNARTDVNVLLARAATAAFTVVDTISSAVMPEPAELEREALEQNVELRGLRTDRAIAALDRRIAQAARYPRVAVNLGYNFQQSENQGGLIASNRTTGPTYGVALSMNLFDGWNTDREVANADIDIASSGLRLAEAEERLRARVQQLYTDYRARRELIALERENMALARENLELALVRFRAGAVIALELREAQNTYVAAAGRLLDAEYRAKLVETDLLELAGRLK